MSNKNDIVETKPDSFVWNKLITWYNRLNQNKLLNGKFDCGQAMKTGTHFVGTFKVMNGKIWATVTPETREYEFKNGKRGKLVAATPTTNYRRSFWLPLKEAA